MWRNFIASLPSCFPEHRILKLLYNSRLIVIGNLLFFHCLKWDDMMKMESCIVIHFSHHEIKLDIKMQTSMAVWESHMFYKWKSTIVLIIFYNVELKDWKISWNNHWNKACSLENWNSKRKTVSRTLPLKGCRDNLTFNFSAVLGMGWWRNEVSLLRRPWIYGMRCLWRKVSGLSKVKKVSFCSLNFE